LSLATVFDVPCAFRALGVYRVITFVATARALKYWLRAAMPTVRNISGPYRFFFYSFDCAEPMHVHARRERMVCKFWLEPVTLASNQGFSARELNQIRRMVELNLEAIREAWHEHCD
jgi:Domain of unknown function (DUF4160)